MPNEPVKNPKYRPKITGAYATNPIVSARNKQPETNVPLPDDLDVEAAKRRVDSTRL